MKIGIPKEVYAGEKRVATTPEAAEKLQKLGFSVAIEAGAGLLAKFSDEAYREAGVEVIEDTKTLWSSSDIILKVRAPGPHPELFVRPEAGNPQLQPLHTHEKAKREVATFGAREHTLVCGDALGHVFDCQP